MSTREYLLPNGGSFYRVNMHSHTNLSDGAQTPEEIKEMYSAHGYSAVAFTEHEGLLDLQRLTDKSFVAINSYEYAFGNSANPPFSFYEGKPKCFDHVEQLHLNLYAKTPDNTSMVCYNPKYVWGKMKNYLSELKYVGDPDFIREYTVDCFNEVIKVANENGFFVVYNHPSWSLNTYPVYSQLKGLTGFEIINGASNRSSDIEYNPIVYDQMARCGQRLICVGGDDNHGVLNFFNGWTMVKADELSYEALTNAITSGNCYATNGPEIYDLYVEDGKVHVSCSDAVGIFFGTAGRRKGCKLSEHGAPLVNEASFTISPDDYYFRITIKDARGNHANTRTYYLDELKEKI